MILAGVCLAVLSKSASARSSANELPANLTSVQQGRTEAVPIAGLGLPKDFDFTFFERPIAPEISGKRIPLVTQLSELGSPWLAQRGVPLPTANTLSHVNFHDLRFGRFQTGLGTLLLFNPEIVLVKFQNQRHVMALRTEPEQELATVRLLIARSDVDFAELDMLERRSFVPSDPLVTNQWHHQVIGSCRAWGASLGQSFVQIAIVDTPFEMSHPDLAANTVSGWDIVTDQPITASSGIEHSTLGAGMAAAVVENGLGVAGAGNCQVLPLNIFGFRSEMYNAVIWAADHGVRVVNISWTGGDSDILQTAGAYLKSKARGILAMSGANLGTGQYATNQPDIYCISMTDVTGAMRSLAGPHIDFAAPGWNVYSTTIGDGYDTRSGTSYSTPLFCGVVAVLFSINPTLDPDEVIGILRRTSVDSGSPGWDSSYGWGRVDFGAAAAEALATRPVISNVFKTNEMITVTTSNYSGQNYSLWRSQIPGKGPWSRVSNAIVMSINDQLLLSDPSPPTGIGFYRIRVEVP